MSQLLHPPPVQASGAARLLEQDDDVEFLVIQVNADGKSFSFQSQARTVGEALAQVRLVAGRQDILLLDGKPVTLTQPLPFRSASLETGPQSGIAEAAGLLTPPRSKWALTQKPDLTITLRRATPVYLSVDGLRTRILTTADTVAQFMEEQGVRLEPEDVISPSLEAPIRAGMYIHVRHALPISIQADGKLYQRNTLVDTVGEALEEAGIRLKGQDRVTPSLATSLRKGMRIKVTRVWEDTLLEEEWLDHDEFTRPDPELEIDHTRVAQEGQDGLRRRRWRLRYEDGEEVGRTLEKEWLEVVPEDRVIAYGTKIIIRTVDTPSGPLQYWRKIRVYATWYDASQGGKDRSDPRYGYTRLGLKAEKGIVAVDTSVIPFYTKMYVPGYGVGMAADTGGAVKGRWIDLAFSEGEPHNWGSRWVDIYLLTPVPPPDQIRWILPDYPG